MEDRAQNILREELSEEMRREKVPTVAMNAFMAVREELVGCLYLGPLGKLKGSCACLEELGMKYLEFSISFTNRSWHRSFRTHRCDVLKPQRSVCSSVV